MYVCMLIITLLQAHRGFVGRGRCLREVHTTVLFWTMVQPDGAGIQ
jgi:hypothetical protein